MFAPARSANLRGWRASGETEIQFCGFAVFWRLHAWSEAQSAPQNSCMLIFLQKKLNSWSLFSTSPINQMNFNSGNCPVIPHLYVGLHIHGDIFVHEGLLSPLRELLLELLILHPIHQRRDGEVLWKWNRSGDELAKKGGNDTKNMDRWTRTKIQVLYLKKHKKYPYCRHLYLKIQKIPKIWFSKPDTEQKRGMLVCGPDHLTGLPLFWPGFGSFC